MKKERDWIDFANLASNVTQNLQLRQANQTLAGLERVAAEQVIRGQEQRDQERQLDRLREHVSQIADDVASLQEHLRENPSAALALGLQIKGLLEKHYVTTASFRAWEDKDRLKDVQKGLESVCEQSTALLTDSQREDAARCAAYLAERDSLNQLIGLQRKKEVFNLGRQQFEKQLAAKQSELPKIQKELSNIRLPFWQRVCTVVGGLGLAFSIAWLLGLFMIIISILHLGKAFSLIPQARNVVRSGPYRWLRHPLYLAEEIALLGTALEYFSALAFGILLLHVSVQVFRIHYEEALLRRTLPGYNDYAAMTWRMMPFFW